MGSSGSDESGGLTLVTESNNHVVAGGDGLVVSGGAVILSGVASEGTKYGDENSSAFGWKDLIGSIQPKTSGGTANTPSLQTYRGGNVREFAFAAGDKIDFVFHMPHDWVPGTDLFVHVHWSHIGTAISGNFVFNFYTTFARGFNQSSNGSFHAEVNSTLTVSSLAIGTTPQYRHRVDEIQLSTAGGGAGLLDTSILETDGLLLMQGVMTTVPTITGGATNLPFIHTVDIHYQAHGMDTTPNKAPGFYNT